MCKPDPSHFILHYRHLLEALSCQLEQQQVEKCLAPFHVSNCLLSLWCLCADGSVHWQRPGKEPQADLPYSHSRAPSAEVEMTAYVLLAQLTSQPAPAQEELSFASLIAKWISSQQNPNGGFSSTQVSCFSLATSHMEVRRWDMPESQVGAQEVLSGRWELEPCNRSAVPAVAAKFSRGYRQICQVVPLGMEMC